MSPAPPLSAEEKSLLGKVMTLGKATNLPVTMTPGELARLIGVVYSDNGKLDNLAAARGDIAQVITPPEQDYYAILDEWFSAPVGVDQDALVGLIRLGAQQIPDFVTYLKCLAELHKRRRKYAMILSAQPMPTMLQVSPRALMEFQQVDDVALASWLTWRKFFYDIDNRAAQETGYLFEPILAAAIGGEPKSPRAKVVVRTGDASKGRQVDCWKVQPDGQSLAYEFKLRVTIAASGQGRFAEELQFAEDCANSGVVPVLVVLDSTPNARLDDLRAQYEAKGGRAFVGEAAWGHLEDEAGQVMARFIEKYVRRPVTAVTAVEDVNGSEEQSGRIRLLDLGARLDNGELIFTLGDSERRIRRNEDASLAGDDGNDVDD